MLRAAGSRQPPDGICCGKSTACNAPAHAHLDLAGLVQLDPAQRVARIGAGVARQHARHILRQRLHLQAGDIVNRCEHPLDDL